MYSGVRSQSGVRACGLHDPGSRLALVVFKPQLSPLVTSAQTGWRPTQRKVTEAVKALCAAHAHKEQHVGPPPPTTEPWHNLPTHDHDARAVLCSSEARIAGRVVLTLERLPTTMMQPACVVSVYRHILYEYIQPSSLHRKSPAVGSIQSR